MVIDRMTHWMRGGLALTLSAFAAVLIGSSVRLLILAQAATDGTALLLNGGFLGLTSLLVAAAVALTCPAALSVAVVAPRHVSLLRFLLPVLFGFGSGALLANAINFITALAGTGDPLGVIVGVLASIAGVVSAYRNRYLDSARALAEALDELYVALTTNENAATGTRAWNALARSLNAGGAPAGWRRNRLIDRHIGAVLAVVMWKLGSIAPHLPPQTRTVVLAHMAKRGADIETAEFDDQALELIAELRYRLAES
jgi:hypothetical protein